MLFFGSVESRKIVVENCVHVFGARVVERNELGNIFAIRFCDRGQLLSQDDGRQTIVPRGKTEFDQFARSVFHGLRTRAIVQNDQAVRLPCVTRHFPQVSLDFVVVASDRKKALVVDVLPFLVGSVVSKSGANDKNIFKVFFYILSREVPKENTSFHNPSFLR